MNGAQVFVITFVASGILVFTGVRGLYQSEKIWPRVVERVDTPWILRHAAFDREHRKNMKAIDETIERIDELPKLDVAAKDAAILVCEKLGGTAVLGFGYKVVCVRELKP
jgi:hypothetical protein